MGQGSEVTRRLTENIWNARDLSDIAELVDESFVLHISGATFAGRDEVFAMVAEQWFDAFPDIRVRIDQQIEVDDYVADVLTFSGTHSGAPFWPGLFRARGLPPIPASGAEFEFTQTSLYRMAAARVAEMWEDFDRVRLFLQLGVTLVVPTAAYSDDSAATKGGSRE